MLKFSKIVNNWSRNWLIWTYCEHLFTWLTCFQYKDLLSNEASTCLYTSLQYLSLSFTGCNRNQEFIMTITLFAGQWKCVYNNFHENICKDPTESLLDLIVSILSSQPRQNYSLSSATASAWRRTIRFSVKRKKNYNVGLFCVHVQGKMSKK